MAKLPLKIKRNGRDRTIRVEVDIDRFERIAAALGLYRQEFLDSLDRAEADVKAGRVKRLKSLKDLLIHSASSALRL